MVERYTALDNLVQGKRTKVGGEGIFRTVIFVCAIFGAALSVAMLVPALVDLAHNNDDWWTFIGSAIAVGMASALLATATRGNFVRFTPRLGFLIVTSVWATSALIGAVPLYLSSLPITFAGAYFESMSGLTTTGSTVLVGLDGLPPGILLWRSMLQWLGGIGIIGMVILILPAIRGGGMSLFRMESSDRSDQILPHLKDLASGLVASYVVLTICCVLVYAWLGMSLFDAINHAMTTLSTGGYSTHDASMGFFQSNAILAASTLFMIFGALPFVIYVRAFLPRSFYGWNDPQVGLFLFLCFALSLSLAVTRLALNGVPVGEALISSAFNLVSVITTTGYASQDYTLWSNASIGIFFLATFLGGCAGSTAGGIKSNRLVILYKLVRSEFRKLIRPSSVQSLQYGNQKVSSEIITTVVIFIFLFFATLLISTVALAFMGLDLITAFSGSLTALTNVGPGLGDTIGPAGNFSTLPTAALWLLSGVMLLGRLELITVLIILAPNTWRD